MERLRHHRLSRASGTLGKRLAPDGPRAASPAVKGCCAVVPISRTDLRRRQACPLIMPPPSGLTQAALAERSGVKRVTVAEIETGRKQGTIATLRALADALGVSLDDLAA
ncbi:helix-turn-helix transcriptional regulator [Rhodobacter capsulatus]|uniref:helix-turn-helix transcriptional regulator n=1 Tax=Rhodobacter capsulatus TaxID=1061 RepID=UPI001CB83D5A|nr:helix-turn-helix transcriptional regulator [Rhodobacter capsulatus]